MATTITIQEVSKPNVNVGSTTAAAATRPEVSRQSDGGSDGSLSFSDAEDRSWHSPYRMSSVSDLEIRSWHSPYRMSSVSDLEIGAVSDPHRRSSISDFSVEVDLESGVQETNKVHLSKVEKDCRICHLSLESTSPETGIAIELGCSCKADLAAAHKHCAEAWFKIKGNKICEICGSVARNVVGANETELLEPWNETSSTIPASTTPAETRSFWHGHRFLNFLLACMVFAFVISWLFHFNVPS